MAALEMALEQVKVDIANARKDLVEAKGRLEKALTSETQERRKADRELLGQMKEAVIGGIHLEAAGVCYIAIGIVLTTFPGGIASLIY